MGIIIVDGRRVISFDGTAGGDMILWKDSAALTAKFIQKEKLTGDRFRVFLGKERIRLPRWCLGMPEPHLHHRSMIYPITKAQWNRYSAGIVKDLKVRMGKIKTVDAKGLSAVSAALKAVKPRRR